MSQVSGETPINFADAAGMFSARSISSQLFWNWRNRGVRSHDGSVVYLEWFREGGFVMTTTEAVERFKTRTNCSRGARPAENSSGSQDFSVATASCSRVFTDDQLALLGTMTDRAVSVATGVSPATVFRERRRLGVAAFRVSMSPEKRAANQKESFRRWYLANRESYNASRKEKARRPGK